MSNKRTQKIIVYLMIITMVVVTLLSGISAFL
ncbi:stressosome-associated protein Prli42 [Pradoshia eiseniae]|nr:stressosome-associated protein Prli42 [Pradoshia eiseniae]